MKFYSLPLSMANASSNNPNSKIQNCFLFPPICAYVNFYLPIKDLVFHKQDGLL